MKKKAFGNLSKSRSSRVFGSKSKRNFKDLGKLTPKNLPSIVNGKRLNGQETVVYKTLLAMGINVKVLAEYGGRNTLGAASVDFELVDYHIALEFDGVFHQTAEGKARDIIREANRAAVGLRTVRIKPNDLPRLRDRLREIIGQPNQGR